MAGMHSESFLLVCFAVPEEAKFFRPLAGNRPDVKILLTGMGPRNAATALRASLGAMRPSLVVSAGFAGGLNPALSAGTVLFADPGKTMAEDRLVGAGARPGRFHFSKRVITRAAEKKQLYQQTGADAVEMESQVICDICGEHNLGSVTVRVVLDTAEEDLPLDFNQYLTEDERLDMRKLVLGVLARPGKIFSLLRLNKQSQMAAKRLAEVLRHVWLNG